MKCFRREAVILAVTLCITGFTGPAIKAAELKSVQEILNFSSAKMADYKTWTADYTQDLNISGNAITISGQIVQKPPREMWMQLDMPMMGKTGQMTMFLGKDGIMWQLMKVGPRPQIMRTDMNHVLSNIASASGPKFNPFDRMNPSKQWDLTKGMFDFKVVEAKEADAQHLYVLEGPLKPSAVTDPQTAADAAITGKMRVGIGRDDGFVRRMELYDKSLTNLVTMMEFKNVKLNPDIPDSTFVYQPPADAHVIDMTEMFEAQIRSREGDAPSTAPKSAPSSAPPAVPSTK